MGDVPEMVERVARAMHARFAAEVNAALKMRVPPSTWEEADAHVQRYYLASAREGIEVMRGLNRDMIKAARRAKINGSHMDMDDWVFPADEEDLIAIGGIWPDYAYDRRRDVADDVAEILLTTWWNASIDAALTPSSNPPARSGESAEPSEGSHG